MLNIFQRITTRKLAVLTIKAALLILIIFYLYYKIDLRETVSVLNKTHLYLIFGIQPLYLLSFAATALRLKKLIGNQEPPLTITFKATIISLGFNAILPFRLSELLKVTYLNKHADIEIGKGLASVFLERVMDTIIMMPLIVMGIGTAFVVTGHIKVLIFTVAVLMFLSLVILLKQQYLSKFISIIPSKTFKNGANYFIDHVAIQIKNRTMIKAITFGLLTWVILYVATYIFINTAGSIYLHFDEVVFVFVTTAIGYAAPIAPGGVGTFEAAAVFALGRYGYAPNEAFALGLALHISHIVSTSLGTAFILMKDKNGIEGLIVKNRGNNAIVRP